MQATSFWSVAQVHPDHVAVIDPDGRETRAGDLLASANQIVHGLRARGLSAGDCVAMMLPNGVEVFEVFMAVAQAGWRVTPINWQLAATEVAYILSDSGSKALIASDRFADVARQAADSAKLPVSERFSVGAIAGFTPLSDLKAGQPTTMPEQRSAGGRVEREVE
jgi:long-chain acyl-CoA synthetase